MKNIKSGFTLIELLIVVAIIAILAAIAVPNFIEAQIRSKVSRAKADMRTCAVAIEAYRVDNNNVPTWGRWGPSTGGASQEQGLDGGFLTASPPILNADGTLSTMEMVPLLTTPIAYLASIPFDPFNSDSYQYGTQYAHYLEGQWSMFMDMTVGSFPCLNQAWEYWGGGNPFNYALFSTGPSLNQNNLWGDSLYDPSNGTVSEGCIAYYDGNGFNVTPPAQ